MTIEFTESPDLFCENQCMDFRNLVSMQRNIGIQEIQNSGFPPSLSLT